MLRFRGFLLHAKLPGYYREFLNERLERSSSRAWWITHRMRSRDDRQGTRFFKLRNEIYVSPRSLPEIHRRLVAHADEAKVVLRKCQGIAFRFPGLVDHERRKILSPLDKFVDIEAANLPSWGEREFGLPVKLESDAKLALLGV